MISWRYDKIRDHILAELDTLLNEIPKKSTLLTPGILLETSHTLQRPDEGINRLRDFLLAKLKNLPFKEPHLDCNTYYNCLVYQIPETLFTLFAHLHHALHRRQGTKQVDDVNDMAPVLHRRSPIEADDDVLPGLDDAAAIPSLVDSQSWNAGIFARDPGT